MLKQCVTAMMLSGFVLTATMVRAETPKEALALVDKAIVAVGGEEKLAKMQAYSWKIKGLLSLGGADSPMTAETTIQGLDHWRQDFVIGGGVFKGTWTLAGEKGWRNLGGNRVDYDKGAVAEEKRSISLLAIPITLLPLKSTQFKLETVPDVTVDGHELAGIRATLPDGRDFMVFFDKETHLPTKVVAKVRGLDGSEVTEETFYRDFKDFGGLKKATRISSRRNGSRFMEQEVTDFQVLEKVEPKVFTDP